MRITSLIDVDNTLIDNDAAKVVIDQRLHALLGDQGTADFWAAYEEVRAECGVVDIPRTMARALSPGTPLERRIALAALFMEFPFRDYIVPGARETIAFLQRRGPVAILSDGDPIFQAAKVTRAGLADLVDGNMLIYVHKEEHLPEIAAAFPADRYLLIDDKPKVIERFTARQKELGGPLETILVRQGKYAAAVPPGPWPGATHTVDNLADVPALFQ
ncbi:MAG TPA: HAD family hydrolase [Thermomicrobiales bacterium]|nr:HAD family hydrolase [Thermomicrobiales bacterium]